MNKVTPVIHRMRMGSRGHTSTFKAVAAYHSAKANSKTCMIVAKDIGEKMRLIKNHFIDPEDIVVKGEADAAGRVISDALYKQKF